MTMGEYKTPGVYIKEKNAFGTSVVEVETAVPAFIGYTEKALNGTEDLTGKPWKITSMAEFIQYFGGMHTPKYSISSFEAPKEDDKEQDKDASDKDENEAKGQEADKTDTQKQATTGKSFVVNTSDANGKHSFIIKVDNNFTLYLHMMLFFANGGGPCYIVSVGDYNSEFKSKTLSDAISSLEKETEPTMLVIPEATNLKAEECYALQQEMVMHCGDKMKNRISIIDVFIDRYPADPAKKVDYAGDFRDKFSTNYPSFVAAYYPYLATSILSDSDITSDMIDAGTDIEEFLKLLGFNNDQIKAFEGVYPKDNKDVIQKRMCPNVHQALLQNSVVYQQLIKAIKEDLNLLPPSAAMAGVYTTVDNSRGVWKAPANVTINSVVKPSISINDYDQQELNMPMSGKAINAIRTFPGEGLKVWGARTLDGNSQDWRYVNVRRTMLFLEESVKNAARAYVFEPNDASTWINMKCMIENFLRSVWKRGGLAGATPEEAFEVHVGLGDTMTGDDILEGILRITVLVAISRPAEFIEITFQQQMQKS